MIPTPLQNLIESWRKPGTTSATDSTLLFETANLPENEAAIEALRTGQPELWREWWDFSSRAGRHGFKAPPAPLEWTTKRNTYNTEETATNRYGISITVATYPASGACDTIFRHKRVLILFNSDHRAGFEALTVDRLLDLVTSKLKG